jgi:hypothetical protein
MRKVCSHIQNQVEKITSRCETINIRNGNKKSGKRVKEQYEKHEKFVGHFFFFFPKKKTCAKSKKKRYEKGMAKKRR